MRIVLTLIVVAVLGVGVFGVFGAVGCTKAPPPSRPAPVNQAMQALALDLGSLEDALAVPAVMDVDRARALGLLDSIEAKATALQQSPAGQSHPLLATGLPAFRGAVSDARVALKRSPPDATAARELARSCRECHSVAAVPAPPSDTRVVER